MALNALDLIINVADPDKNGLLDSISSKRTHSLPLQVLGDGGTVNVKLVQPSENGSRYFDYIDLTGATVKVAIGGFDVSPVSGTWPLSYNSSSTGLTALDSQISAAALQTAINANSAVIADGLWSVTKTGNLYTLTATANGVRHLFATTANALTPISGVNIWREQTGSSTQPDIQQIELAQLPYAYQDTWTALASVPGSGVTLTDANSHTLQTITFPDGTYDGGARVAISSGAGSGSFVVSANDQASTLQTKIAGTAALATGSVAVTGNQGGPFTVQFTGVTGITAMTATNINVLVPMGVTGELNLSTPAMRDVVFAASGDYATLVFQVTVTMPGYDPVTVYQQKVKVNRTAINPAAMVPPPLPDYYTEAEIDARFALKVGGNLYGTSGSDHAIDVAARYLLGGWRVIKDANTGSSFGNSQLILTGAGNTNQQLYLAYDTTGDFAALQAINSGVALTTLKLNPLGGHVSIAVITDCTEINASGTDRDVAIGQGGQTWTFFSDIMMSGASLSVETIRSSVDNAEIINLNSYQVFDFNGGIKLDLGDSTTGLGIHTNSGAPSAPRAGDIYLNTTDHHFYGYNGTTWKQLDN